MPRSAGAAAMTDEWATWDDDEKKRTPTPRGKAPAALSSGGLKRDPRKGAHRR